MAKESKVEWSSALKLFRRFWPYLRPERRITAAIGALMLLVVPSGVISPLVVRHIFDVVLPEKDVRLLFLLGIALVGLTLLAFGLGYVQSLLSITLRNRVRFRVTRRLFGHVLRLPLRYFDRTESGALMSRVRDDVAALDNLMTDTLVGAVVDLLKAVLYFLLLLFLDTGLALSGLLLVALIFSGVLIVSRPLRRRSEAAREADTSSSAALHEALAGLTTARTTAQHRNEARRYAGTVKETIRKSARRDVLGTATGSAFGLLGVLGGYVIIAVGAYRILLGLSTFGNLFAFFIYLTQLMSSAGGVFALVPRLQRGFASLERVYAVLDEAPEDAAEDAPRPAAAPAGEIVFDRVGFEYEPGRAALADVDLEVRPGEVLALVGRSGAGKTTLVHLLPRLYEPTSGEIRLDGQPLASYPLRWLRERIGVVPQDVFLFNRSIRDNIAYATPDASDERVHAAAAAAHAAEFVERLEHGYDTVVGERGVRLSGGEKQRLAIAREFLRDPPVLILDEATSNLDAESEGMVRDAITRLMAGRTCFVIAHRLSTVRNAGRIVVLDEGRIAEAGSHEELLRCGGLYAELHRKQLLERPPPPGRYGAP